MKTTLSIGLLLVVGLFTASAQSPRSEEQKIAAILDT